VRLAPYRLAQVLENLLDNAAGFAPSASEVEVTVTRKGPWAVLRAADPRAEHPGLGLAIVKAVVEGYGGMVHAANREGGGAVFEVRLPAE
jgi:two-component system OmpR family sensor kinase